MKKIGVLLLNVLGFAYVGCMMFIMLVMDLIWFIVMALLLIGGIRWLFA